MADTILIELKLSDGGTLKLDDLVVKMKGIDKTVNKAKKSVSEYKKGVKALASEIAGFRQIQLKQLKDTAKVTNLIANQSRLIGKSASKDYQAYTAAIKSSSGAVEDYLRRNAKLTRGFVLQSEAFGRITPKFQTYLRNLGVNSESIKKLTNDNVGFAKAQKLANDAIVKNAVALKRKSEVKLDSGASVAREQIKVLKDELAGFKQIQSTQLKEVGKVNNVIASQSKLVGKAANKDYKQYRKEIAATSKSYKVLNRQLAGFKQVEVAQLNQVGKVNNAIAGQCKLVGKQSNKDFMKYRESLKGTSSAYKDFLSNNAKLTSGLIEQSRQLGKITPSLKAYLGGLGVSNENIKKLTNSNAGFAQAQKLANDAIVKSAMALKNQQSGAKKSSKSFKEFTANIGGAKTQVKILSGTLNGYKQVNVGLLDGIGKTSKALQAQRANLTKSRRVFSRLTQEVTSLFAAMTILRDIYRRTDAIQKMNNQLKVVTKSTFQLSKITEELFEVSQRTRTDFIANVQLYQRLSLGTRNLAVTTKDLTEVVEGLAGSLTIGGATAKEATGAIFQFSQAMQKGKLDGDEFRTVSEAAGFFMTQLAIATNKTRGELIEMSRAGQLTTEWLTEGTKKVKEMNEELLKTIPPTLSQSFVKLNNALNQFLNTSTGASITARSLSSVISTIANNFDTLVNLLIAGGGIAAISKLVTTFFKLRKEMTRVAAAAAAVTGPAGLVAIGTAATVAAIGYKAFNNALEDSNDKIREFEESLEGLSAKELESLAFKIKKQIDDTKKSISELEKIQFSGILGKAKDILGIGDSVLEQERKKLKEFEEFLLILTDKISIAFNAETPKKYSEELNKLVDTIKEFGKELDKRTRRLGFDEEKLLIEDLNDANEEAILLAIKEGVTQDKIKKAREEGRMAIEKYINALGKLRGEELTGVKTARDLEFEIKLLDKALEELIKKQTIYNEKMAALGTQKFTEEGGVQITITGGSDVANDLDIINKKMQKINEEKRKLQNLRILSRVESQDLKKLVAGFELGLQDYVDANDDAFSQIQDATLNAFQGMEDALTEFVATGKLSFASLVDSIVADLSRIAVRQAITVPLARALFGPGAGGAGGLSNLIGGALSIFGGGAAAPAPQAPFVPGLTSGSSYQKGTDFVPRTGLALLHRGEAVIPANQNKERVMKEMQITNNISINGSVDAETARRTGDQIALEIGRAMNRARIRNG